MEYDALTHSTVSLEANCGYADSPLMQVVADKRRPRPDAAFEEAEAALELRSLLDLQATQTHTHPPTRYLLTHPPLATYLRACSHTYSHRYLLVSYSHVYSRHPQLSAEERAIVELKYGLHGHEPHSLRDICAAQGCTSKEVYTADRLTPTPTPTLTLTPTQPQP